MCVRVCSRTTVGIFVEEMGELNASAGESAFARMQRVAREQRSRKSGA
jgi:hypothetical protein